MVLIGHCLACVPVLRRTAYATSTFLLSKDDESAFASSGERLPGAQALAGNGFLMAQQLRQGPAGVAAP